MFRSLFQRPTAHFPGKKAARRRPPARRLCLEPLEDRTLLAVFPVTTLADDGVGSLRQAILDANAMPDDDIITFGVTGTINLASALPDLSSNIDIQGPGAASLTVQRSTALGTPNFRIFTVSSGATVGLSGLTIARGRIDLGFAFAFAQGGGIYNGGALTVSDCTVADNFVASFADGDLGPVPSGSGGGIFNVGALTVSNSTISGNTANGSYGGIWNGPGSALTVSSSTISGNTPYGISNYGTLTVSNSTLSGNILPGIHNIGGALVSNSTISGNTGEGGILNFGTLTVSNSTISGNTATTFGTGGIYNSNRGTLTVSNSTISGNSTTYGPGGGILNTGTLTVSNSTITGNSTIYQGGGIFSQASSAVTVTISNCTISGNSADESGGGIRVFLGTVNLRNSILAGNTVSGPGALGPDLSGPLTSSGYNLIGNTSGGSGFAPTDLLNVDPLLGPLQDNGGPTFTHALLPGSPALDAGDNADAPATDQRGLPRVVAGTIDIGSFEVQVGPVASFFLFPVVATVSVGVPVDLVVVALDAYGHVVTDFEGTVYLVSTDPAVAPVAYTFHPQDGGIAHLTDAVTFRTPGPQLLLAIDATFTAIGLGLYDVA